MLALGSGTVADYAQMVSDKCNDVKQHRRACQDRQTNCGSQDGAGHARANRVRELWTAGKPVINSWCGIPSSFSAEVMAHAGWDSLVVDMQHGMIDYQMMETMLQGISENGVGKMGSKSISFRALIAVPRAACRAAPIAG